MYLLDTLPLIYWTLDPGKVPKTLEDTLTRAKNLYVSSISLWEMGMMKKKGYLELPLDIKEFQIRLEKTSRITLLNVDEHIWVKALEMDYPGDDVNDRVILATAQLHKLVLVTPDRHIQDYYLNTLW